MTGDNINARNFQLDLLRVIACIMVVAMHSPIPPKTPSALDGVFLSSLSYLSAPCIGLFFMVSGALLLPVRDPYNIFLTRRFTKIIFPTLVWTLIYIVANVLKCGADSFSIRSILSIPFSSQGTSVLWFMYTLSGLYLLAPVISPWIERASEKEMRFYILLWGISLCYPILRLMLKINESETGMLYYFSGYLGYFVLGYYFKSYWPGLPSRKYVYMASICAISLITPVILRLWGVKIQFYSLFWYLSIFVAIMCAG